MNKTSQLPTEVLCIIFSYVDDKKDVLQLLRTCKSLKPLFQALAYSKFTLTESTGNTLEKQLTALTASSDSPGYDIKRLYYAAPDITEYKLNLIADKLPSIEYLLTKNYVPNVDKYFDELRKLHKQSKFQHLKSFFPQYFPGFNTNNTLAYTNCALEYKNILTDIACVQSVDFAVLLSCFPCLENLSIYCYENLTFQWADALIENCKKLKSVCFLEYKIRTLGDTIATARQREDAKKVVVNLKHSNGDYDILRYIQRKFSALDFIRLNFDNAYGSVQYHGNVFDYAFHIINDLLLTKDEYRMFDYRLPLTSIKTKWLTLEYTSEEEFQKNIRLNIRALYDSLATINLTLANHSLQSVPVPSFLKNGNDMLELQELILIGDSLNMFQYEKLLKETLQLCTNLKYLSLMNMKLNMIIKSSSVSHLRARNCHFYTSILLGMSRRTPHLDKLHLEHCLFDRVYCDSGDRESSIPYVEMSETRLDTITLEFENFKPGVFVDLIINGEHSFYYINVEKCPSISGVTALYYSQVCIKKSQNTCVIKCKDLQRIDFHLGGKILTLTV